MKQPKREFPLKKNDVIEAEITDYGAEGEGVAKIDGVPVFIPRAMAGERVRAKIVAVKRSHAFAIVQKMISESPDRRTPPCRYSEKCGGCALQHIDYPVQLELKRRNIIQTVQKTAKLTLPVEPIIPSEPLRCRNKLSLPVRADANGNIRIGFFRVRSHDIVDIQDCLMQTHSCAPLIASLKEFMSLNKLTAYSDSSQQGDIRHLCVRTIAGNTSVTVVGTQKNPERIRPFYEAVSKLYQNVTLWYNIHSAPGNVIFGKEFILLGGKDALYSVSGLVFPLHPAAFFQVNDSVRLRLFQYVTDAARASLARHKGTNGETVAIEAYAGQGILSALLAPYFDRVCAVEIFPESIAAGERMKQLSQIENLSFYEGSCSEVLPSVFTRHHPNVLIADPPRAGLDCETARLIADSGAQTVIYVSCNPATLARDLEVLTAKYRIFSAAAFDMFPQTPNVETAVVLDLL